MKILVDDVDIRESVHAGKRVLLDTMILCYAHDRLSSHHAEASLIVKASLNGLIKAYVSYQNLAEFYSIMTGGRVKRPLTPKEAAELCSLYEESVAVGKLLPTTKAFSDAFLSAKELSIVDGEVFDSVLAHTAREDTDSIWTENTQDFKKYEFLNVENPFKWKWEEI